MRYLLLLLPALLAACAAEQRPQLPAAVILAPAERLLEPPLGPTAPKKGSDLAEAHAKALKDHAADAQKVRELQEWARTVTAPKPAVTK